MKKSNITLNTHKHNPTHTLTHIHTHTHTQTKYCRNAYKSTKKVTYNTEHSQNKKWHRKRQHHSHPCKPIHTKAQCLTHTPTPTHTHPHTHPHTHTHTHTHSTHTHTECHHQRLISQVAMGTKENLLQNSTSFVYKTDCWSSSQHAHSQVLIHPHPPSSSHTLSPSG